MKVKLGLIVLFIFVMNVSFISATRGVSYDLTSTVSSIIGASPISMLVADPENEVVYFGTIDGKLGYYNQSSNSSVDLTHLVSAWVGANYIFSGTVDTEHNRFYFTAGQIMNLWGFVSIEDNSATQLVPTWYYMTSLKYDSESEVIWYATNNNEFGYINTSTNSVNIITTSGYGDICIDYEDDRVYVVVNSGSYPPYYYDKNTLSIVSLTSIPFYTLTSCDIDPINHIIYMGRCESFQSAGYYLPDTDAWVTSYWNGDSVCDVVTRYLPQSNNVVVMQSGIYGSIYNITDNSTINLLTTEQGTWMDLGYSGMAGDYMNTSQRMYMGFSDGSFGYYDDSITGGCEEDWIAYNGSCEANNTYVKYYLDNNSCGSFDELPIDNGTEAFCNYCDENLVKNFLSDCTVNGTRSYLWLDTNYYSCCVITGILSDCDILYSPYNETNIEACNFTTTNFDFQIDNVTMFGWGIGGLNSDKVYGKIWLNDTNNSYSCISYVKTSEGQIIQTNPPYTKRTDTTVAVIPKEIEDREFFITSQGIANVYWTDHNLIVDGRQYIFGVECSGNGQHLVSEKVSSALYKNVNTPITRWFWAKTNITGIIMVLIFGIIAVFIIAWIIYRVRRG